MERTTRRERRSMGRGLGLASEIALVAMLAGASLGCGDQAVHGAPPPPDPPAATPPAAETTTTTATGTETAHPTGTETATPTGTETATPTGTETATPTGTETATPAGTETATPTVPSPTHPVGADPAQQRMLDGYACLGRSDYACVERLFGEGRATDARELGILVRAQRAAGDDTAACASMQALVDRFPQSPEAARTRVLRAQRCTPHP